MAVGEAPLPQFFPIAGVRIGTASAGIKKPGRQDITIFEIAEGATVAGVFTKNAFCAAPVQICQKYLRHASAIRYLLINTGNANAGTGKAGLNNAQATIAALAEKTQVSVEKVLPFSTGVIGEHLPVEKVIQALDAGLANLSADHWSAAAKAIMTTDTRPKGVSKKIHIAGKAVHISGISKGAGMIKPNMATMLAYVACDAAIAENQLKAMLQHACRLSFNRITVDGDTSTNDSAILIATGQGELNSQRLNTDQLQQLQKAIDEVFVELAQLIIRDAEGATKFVHVRVIGGLSEKDCEKTTFTIAESPLVKTALYASDANWGRILAALGRSGVADLDVSRVKLHINDVLIAENGGRAASYNEQQGIAAVSGSDIRIDIDLQLGQAQATVWTCDLSNEYVTINAEYRT